MMRFLRAISILGLTGCSVLQDPGFFFIQDGAPAGMDGGVRMDGQVTEDAGRDADLTDGGCAESCDDGVDCTVDACEAASCTHTLDDDRCDGEDVCDLDAGCLPSSGCDPAECVAGPCETAMCVGDECVIEPTCGDAEECCAGACVPLGCDDDVDCTEDSCGAAGCEHAPTDALCDDANPCTVNTCDEVGGCAFPDDDGATCDDALFCNGGDTCVAGACDTHAGNPCAGATVCDAGAMTCTGCIVDSDCPAPIVPGFGACVFEGHPMCDTSGTESRTVVSFTCDAGTCDRVETEETRNCARTTEDLSCGTRSCPAFGACGFSDECDEAGTRSRTCTQPLCRSGGCSTVSELESESCSRATTGLDCGSLSCPSYGTCSGFSGTCGEDGTQSRSCTQPECAAGACGGSHTVPQTRSCVRDTDGQDCGVLSCPSWGTCGGYSNTCDATGTQSRTCTQPTCATGSCTGSVSEPQSQSCSRANRDGITCGSETCTPGACLSNGMCGGQRTTTCTTPICDSGSCSGEDSNTTTSSCPRPVMMYEPCFDGCCYGVNDCRAVCP